MLRSTRGLIAAAIKLNNAATSPNAVRSAGSSRLRYLKALTSDDDERPPPPEPAVVPKPTTIEAKRTRKSTSFKPEVPTKVKKPKAKPPAPVEQPTDQTPQNLMESKYGCE